MWFIYVFANLSISPLFFKTIQVILVGYNWIFRSSDTTNIYSTTNAGETFTKTELPFLIDEAFQFSPLTKNGLVCCLTPTVFYRF